MLPLSKVSYVFLIEDKYARGEGHVLTNINLLPVPCTKPRHRAAVFTHTSRHWPCWPLTHHKLLGQEKKNRVERRRAAGNWSVPRVQTLPRSPHSSDPSHIQPLKNNHCNQSKQGWLTLCMRIYVRGGPRDKENLIVNRWIPAIFFF